jgi:hypothetical protein
MSEKFSIKKMPKPQRYSFYFLIFLTIGIIFLWLWQFNYNLSSHLPKYSSEVDSQLSLDSNLLRDFQDFDSPSQPDSLVATPSNNQATIIYEADEVPHAWIDFESNFLKEFENQLVFDDLIIGDQEDYYSNILGGQGDPNSLRQLLLSSGLEKEIVDQLSDEELMEIYYSILTD